MKKLTFKQKNRIFNAVLLSLVLAAFIFCLLSLVGCQSNGNTCGPGEIEKDTIIPTGPRQVPLESTICVPDTSSDNDDQTPSLYLHPDGYITNIPIGVPLM